MPDARDQAVPVRILVVDPAPRRLAVPELVGMEELGLHPVVNLRRVGQAELRSAISSRWAVTDFDGFAAVELMHEFTRGRGYDALKCRASIPLTAAVLRHATGGDLDRRLKIVVKAASGVDSFDGAAAEALGVAIRSTPGANALAVAELVVALMLDCLRGVSHRSDLLHRQDWQAATASLPSRSLGQCRVGLIGTGEVAQAVAQLLEPFGADTWVLGSPRLDPSRLGTWPVRRCESLGELLESCDVVSIHVPATAETRGMIGLPQLRHMKPDSVLINTSRASVVTEDDLDRALRDDRMGPAWAAVDVFAREGDAFDSPLMRNRRAILTPHIAGMTWQAMEMSSRRILEELASFYSQEMP